MIAKCGFHPADIDRINTSEKWLRLFIEYNDLDMKKALTQLWDTCVWRKNFGTNDLDVSQLRQEYLHEGFMFPRNRDIDGKRLLIFRSKLYVRGTKDMDDVKRILVYWVERLMYREEDLAQISVFFDLKDSGLSNMDMEYTRYIINLFKFYYPNSLNYIIIFEMPWILNTTFKIIKSLLPAKAVARMKFVNGKTLHEFVDESNMLDIWGGSDNYTYKFEEGESSAKSINNNNLNASGRKVHFAKLSPTESPMSEQHGSSFTEKGNAGDEMLRVVQDTLLFNKTGNDYSGSVEIINIDLKPITYKVKTTAPDKFRVRPSSGVLAPGSSMTVNVVLVPGCQLSALSREKFLVMCMALGADKQTNSQDIAELWKNTPSHSHLVEQHKLKCLLPGLSHVSEVSFKNGTAFSGSSGSDSDRQISHLVQTVHELNDTVARLDSRLKKNQMLFFLALLAIASFCVATLYIVKGSIEEHGMGYCVKRDD
ncbi:motile sperm domain-containing protein 2-like isoform X2 [Phlebotomus argentipes]|uniref:motile sperm domain-containing protein 2-like isoform X2 n=1 Tax=Phlebotomus argentipes TaxID=94469 RepID=UPI002893176E|nr:motile sperm domain-containing protein 2-like isoform X2 [Phlebotomus argentipes]